MTELFESHISETKRQIEQFAKEIMLNKDDLAVDKRMLAPLFQKVENLGIADHLRDLANDRMEAFFNLVSDEEQKKMYKEELIQFLRKTYRKNI